MLLCSVLMTLAGCIGEPPGAKPACGRTFESLDGFIWEVLASAPAGLVNLSGRDGLVEFAGLAFDPDAANDAPFGPGSATINCTSLLLDVFHPGTIAFDGTTLIVTGMMQDLDEQVCTISFEGVFVGCREIEFPTPW